MAFIALLVKATQEQQGQIDTLANAAEIRAASGPIGSRSQLDQWALTGVIALLAAAVIGHGVLWLGRSRT
jgi:hypothetical protein